MTRRAMFPILAALAILAAPILATAQVRSAGDFIVTVQTDLVPDQTAAAVLADAIKKYIQTGFPEFVARDLKQVTLGRDCWDNDLPTGQAGDLFFVNSKLAAFAQNGIITIYQRGSDHTIGSSELEICIYNQSSIEEFKPEQAFAVIDPLITRAIVQSINPYRFSTPDLPGMTGTTVLDARGAGIYNTRMNLLYDGFYQRFAYEWAHPEVGPFVRAVRPGQQTSTARSEVWADAYDRYVTVTLECAVSLCQGKNKPPKKTFETGEYWINEVLPIVTKTAAYGQVYDRILSATVRKQIFVAEFWPLIVSSR